MTDYEALQKQLLSLTEDVDNLVSNLANTSALLNEALDDINWAGFYLMEDGKLVLGPFQGKVACTLIPVGKGVCGTAALEKRTQRVKNVHEFPGHIACDCASNSEIVIPLFSGDEVAAVLDIDSPTVGRFTIEDQKGLEGVAAIVETFFRKSL